MDELISAMLEVAPDPDALGRLADLADDIEGEGDADAAPAG